MTQHLDFPHLLALAQQLPGDPACEDFGKLDAAAHRTRSAHLGREVYGSDWLKAAALLETIARLRPLEDHNLLFAWVAAEAFLTVNGHRVACKPGDALALVAEAELGHAGVRQIAARLRDWTT